MHAEATPLARTTPPETGPDANLVCRDPKADVRRPDRSIRRARASGLRRRCLIALATLTLSAGASFATSAPASAAQLAASGSIGYVNTGIGICRYYTLTNHLNLEVYAPDIYAPNHRSGGGNDWAAARYKLHAIDRYGNVVQSSGYSGWAWAYDNSPATYSKVPTPFYGIPNGSGVIVQVEWSGGTTTSGLAFHSIDRYTVYSGGLGPYGGLTSCARV